MTRSKKDATRPAAKEVVTPTPEDPGRRQHTDDGDVGIPVEEMSQSQRREVGKKLADGEGFKEAVAEASGPADETGDIEKKDDAK